MGYFDPQGRVVGFRVLGPRVFGFRGVPLKGSKKGAFKGSFEGSIRGLGVLGFRAFRVLRFRGL